MEENEDGAMTTGHKAKPGKSRKAAAIAIAAALVIAVSAAGIGMHIRQQNVEKERVAAIAKQKAERKAYADAALERAYDGCLSYTQSDALLHDTLSLEDSNRTLIISAPNSAATTYEAYKCVAELTGMPQSVQSKISNTTAMSGMQSDSWDNIEATWTYAGGDGAGLNVTLQIK